jgi:hypothetical protein
VNADTKRQVVPGQPRLTYEVTAQRRADLGVVIEKSFVWSDGTYGYRRVHAELTRWGVDCGLELVRSLMRELGWSVSGWSSPATVGSHCCHTPTPATSPT